MSFKTSVSVIAFAVLAALPLRAVAEGHVNAETVVATVNGTDIKLGHMIVLKQRLPAQYQQLAPEVLFEGILDQLVQQTLLAEKVDNLTLGSQMTLENEDRALRAADEMRGIVEAALTDEAIQAAYDEAFGGAEPEIEFNASHILVETEDEAKELVTALEGGADFAELAKEKSTGPSGPRGGELGWFGLGAMVPPFEEAVATMEVGQISAPVQTQFGWHVIKLNEERVKDAPPIEAVRDQLTDSITRSVIETHVAGLTDGANVTRKTVEDIDPSLLDNTELLEN